MKVRGEREREREKEKEKEGQKEREIRSDGVAVDPVTLCFIFLPLSNIFLHPHIDIFFLMLLLFSRHTGHLSSSRSEQ